jgi:hypothetical protein
MLHEQAGPRALRFVRGVVFGLWFVLVAATPLPGLLELPPGVFQPPGLMGLVPDPFWAIFASGWGLAVFRIGLSGLLLAIVVLPRPHRCLLLLAAAGLLLFEGFLSSWGSFVHHGRFGLLYTAIVLSLAPSPSPDAGRRTVGATLQLGALLLGVAYALIGLHRFFLGGMGIFVNDALPTYMLVRTFEPGGFEFQLSYRLLEAQALVPVLKAGFLAATMAEVASPAAVFHPRLRRAWLAVIVPFHFVTLFTMNIFFWENLILIGILFTDLPSRVEKAWGERRGVLQPSA